MKLHDAGTALLLFSGVLYYWFRTVISYHVIKAGVNSKCVFAFRLTPLSCIIPFFLSFFFLFLFFFFCGSLPRFLIFNSAIKLSSVSVGSFSLLLKQSRLLFFFFLSLFIFITALHSLIKLHLHCILHCHTLLHYIVIYLITLHTTFTSTLYTTLLHTTSHYLNLTPETEINQ